MLIGRESSNFIPVPLYPRKCVVNVTQIKSVDKRSIKEKIGALSASRLEEIENGIRLVLSMR